MSENMVLSRFTQLIIHPNNLNDTHFNSYSIPSDPLEIGLELTMDHPLENPFDLLVNKLVPWCALILCSALEIPRLRLRFKIIFYIFI